MQEISGAQRVEIFETGHIDTVNAEGVMYTIIERLHIRRTTLPDRTRHSVPTEKSYRTINGQPVIRQSDAVFVIESTGMSVTRLHTRLHRLDPGVVSGTLR